MNYKQNVEEYLQEKGVKIIKNETKELAVLCLFNSCDKDSKGSEAHLYIEKETGRFHCKKCGVSGGIKKLREHFGDFTQPKDSQLKSSKYFTQKLVDECVSNLPDTIRKYLNDRGVSDDVISAKKIGFGNFYGQNWITIPITKGDDLEPSFFYLRKDPNNKSEKTPKNLSFPKGKGEVVLYGDYASEGDNLVICEGIIDCLSLLSLGIKALASTGGCMTFKEDWVEEKLVKTNGIYVAYDRDEAGEKGAERVLKMLRNAKIKSLYKVTLPEEVGEKGDVNDYLTKLNLSVQDLFGKYAELYPKRIDIRQFKELSVQDLEQILSKTIIGDRETKLITFYCQLSAFTYDGQFNVMFNSPSSTGKSYTALQVSNLFPKDSLMKLGHSSATAFFHDSGKYNKETNTITVDLSHKILIFTENQHYQLLEKLRGFLSHDEKVMNIKVTDKNQKGGNKTKNIELIGYSAVVFCTALLKSDAQEKTRFIILSPEISDEKISGGIAKVIQKESENDKYKSGLDLDLDRKSLKLRIEAIRDFEIENIYISPEDSNYLKEQFLLTLKGLLPRHQRDIQRIICIAKSVALLNLWFRNQDGKNITIQKSDIDVALNLYSKVSITQNLGISPYLYQIYKDTIKPCYIEKKWEFALPEFQGITYQEIMNFHFKGGKGKLDYNYLRQQIIPELEACGLIEKEYTGVKVRIHITENIEQENSESMSSDKK
jgi:5S rRNA maturation endonuclease (ribonuclease M5)